MGPNSERDQTHLKEHNQQQCLGFHAIVVHKVARTTSTIHELSHWKTSGPFKPITKGSTVPSHLCVENAAKHLRLKEIGEPMKRIVESYGIVLVVLISNTKGHSRITLGLLAKVTLLTHLLKVLKKLTRNASLDQKTNLHISVQEKYSEGFYQFSAWFGV